LSASRKSEREREREREREFRKAMEIIDFRPFSSSTKYAREDTSSNKIRLIIGSNKMSYIKMKTQ